MNQFRTFLRWAWSVLVVLSLAFAMGGCDGSDGAQGPAGATGATGPTGPTGPQGPPGPGTNPVEAAVAQANVESCNVCHEGNGDFHQAYYDEYVDSTLGMTITNVSAVAAGGGFDVTVDFSLTQNGAPLVIDDFAAFLAELNADGVNANTASFYVVQLTAAGQFVNSGGFFPSLNSSLITSLGGGDYRLVQNLAYNPANFDGGAIVGKVGIGVLDFPDNPYNPGGGRRVRGYADVATAAFEVGGGTLAAFQSLANVEGCEGCHGMPYRKHANIEAVIAGVPTFTQCKACHSDDRSGGHPEWQWMVDDPAAWAANLPNAVPAAVAAQYPYTANLMNDVHMSHAMEFPYPQSMANCVKCHEGNITEILDNSNFTAQTCKSCHVIDGVDAWPADPVTGPAGPYAQTHRPPPFEFLWNRISPAISQLHDVADFDSLVCTGCHGAQFPAFNAYHTGYDTSVYDSNGARYADTNSVSVDAVTLAGNLLTVNFSATNVDISPTLAISFYGWDTKHYIVPAHERDANVIDCGPPRPGCNIEWSPGSTKPFFTEDAASVPGDWMVTFDMSLFQAYKTDPIPQLIADGTVKFAEITILPRLQDANGDDINLLAVSTTFDLGGSVLVDNYFQGTEATVAFDKCEACHDNLSTLVHTGRGRFGDSMQTCKACHATTFGGSHLEMQSRSIDSYVHAIHRFQPLDENDAINSTDLVDIARNAQHKEHALPYFTSLACEACHVDGTYNVPDQSKSMPGLQSSSWDDIADPNARAIGTVPELVQGATSRSCGSCHRAEWIKEDLAGDLAAFDAHTAAFGSAVPNEPTDANADGLSENPVLFGIIDKIMSLFE